MSPAEPRRNLPDRLVLFDIDGTLIGGGGAGQLALRLGFEDRFGIPEKLDGIEIAGRTDAAIARQIFAKHRIEPTPENLARFFDGYLHHLAIEIPRSPGRILPGIIELLDALRASGRAAIGLLTGNLSRGARIKLAHHGVWDYFEFGAFADDHHDRNALGPFAAARAAEFSGRDFPPEDTFVLGDTPHDVACARAIGAVAVAIATGGHSLEDLAKHAPDFLFDDLSDVQAVLRALRVTG